MVEGLSSKEAKDLLKKVGPNEISNNSKNSPLTILLRQIRTNYIIYLLTIATILSFVVGKTITAYTILAVIFVVIIVGFFMEYRAEKAIAALKELIIQQTVVVRDAKEQVVPSRELVPGDIIILHSGDKVPADCVILSQKEFRVNESILTSESNDIHKMAFSEEDLLLAEEKNKVFMGTFVVNGHCKAQIIHTGMNTEFGKIAGMITQTQKDIPLQHKLNKIIKYMSINAVIFAVVTGLVMMIRGGPLTPDLLAEILIVVIAISVSAFPEGYPVVLVTTLAAGARRMAAKNAIVNRMAIIETLGETTIICTDKTGTLTKGEMTVKEIYTPEHIVEVTGAGYSSKGKFLLDEHIIDPNDYAHIHTLIKTGLLCNDAKIEQHLDSFEYKVRGSQTETALLILAAKAGLHDDQTNYEKIEEIPFNSHNKMMSVLITQAEEHTVYAKGAPEILLEKCDEYRKNNKRHKMTQKDKEHFLTIANDYAAKSYRVLALARKIDATKEDLEGPYTFLGFMVMEDPAREEAKSAVQGCLHAGIGVKMLTGDNKNTARAIAQEVGLEGGLLEGHEIDALTDEELALRLKETNIFARVRPEHKMRIVHILKEQGEVVAMTGDGVNDAPALKEAHIGVAMGKNGTDVSREVSDLILKDDNFATIVEAIVQGRTIFKNIQKVTAYQMSITLAQVVFIFISIALGFPLPLVAMQILFINLLSDELTAIMLGFNSPSLDVLKEKPRRGSNIIDKNIFILLLVAIGVIMLVTLLAFIYLVEIIGVPLATAQAFAFITIVLFGVTNAFNFRSFRYPTVSLPFNANKYLLAASAVAILCTVLLMYTPINVIFETTPLPAIYWLYAALLSLTIIIVFDILKYYNNKHKFLELH